MASSSAAGDLPSPSIADGASVAAANADTLAASQVCANSGLGRVPENLACAQPRACRIPWRKHTATELPLGHALHVRRQQLSVVCNM